MTVRMHGREFTMKRKALALLLAAVMTTAMLAGCGKTQTGGSDGASQGTTPAGTEKEADASSAGSGEKAELTMWGSWRSSWRALTIPRINIM